MKPNILLLACFSVLLVNCRNESEDPRNPFQDILQDLPDFNEFQPRGQFIASFDCEVTTEDPEWLETFPEGIIPWVSIENPQEELVNLLNRDHIVTEQTSAILVIDYPVSKPVEIDIQTDNPNGFTLEDIVIITSKEYNRIYEEDLETAEQEANKSGDTSLMDGIRTKGKYGIWGHGISELDLSSFEIRLDADGTVLIYLNVVS